MVDAVHFVDANVPMYAIGADHPLKAPCVTILRAIGRGELAATTDTEILQELLHRYVSLGQRARAVEVTTLVADAIPAVASVTQADLRAAMVLIAAHPELPVRDAIHAAVMQRTGVELIISADRHFDAVLGLTRIDPAAWPA
jgi:predicted nucleic acid-binding protein